VDATTILGTGAVVMENLSGFPRDLMHISLPGNLLVDDAGLHSPPTILFSCTICIQEASGTSDSYISVQCNVTGRRSGRIRDWSSPGKEGLGTVGAATTNYFGVPPVSLIQGASGTSDEYISVQ
jgi:hypothetical protein